MALTDQWRGQFLLCRVENCLCALPLDQVIETMRPLPVEPIASAPPFVAGLSVIRGVPVPVVDAALLLHGSPSTASRFVTVKVDKRWVALMFDAVLGVIAITPESFRELPPLLGDAAAEVVSALGALDHQLLFVLRSGRIVPDSVWAALKEGKST